MTLHLYGSITGHVLAVSDSRTTTLRDDDVRLILCDRVTKAFSVCSSEHLDRDLAALVLVQGRATFTIEGTQTTAQKLLEKALLDARPSTTTVEELGEFLWKIVHSHWWNCVACQHEREEAKARDADDLARFGSSPFFNPDDEHGCDYHRTFTLIVLGFNSGISEQAVFYKRDWLAGDEIQTGPLPEGRFYSSVEVTGLPELRAPIGLSVAGADAQMIGWLHDRFVDTIEAIDRARAADEVGQIRGIGGEARAMVLSAAGVLQTPHGWPIADS